MRHNVRRRALADIGTLVLGREFKGIFFDLDGTLVDIHGPLYIAARNALDDLGHKPLTREGYHQALARDDVWLGVPEHQRPEYLKLAFAYFITELDKTESLKHAAARASILPQACMYVGDEPRDIMAATNAGYGAAIAVATGPASYRHLETHPLDRLRHDRRD